MVVLTREGAPQGVATTSFMPHFITETCIGCGVCEIKCPTHTITGAIIGVGSIKRLSAVRWGVAGRIVWAWVLTIPASASIAAVIWWIVSKTIAP